MLNRRSTWPPGPGFLIMESWLLKTAEVGLGSRGNEVTQMTECLQFGFPRAGCVTIRRRIICQNQIPARSPANPYFT